MVSHDPEDGRVVLWPTQNPKGKRFRRSRSPYGVFVDDSGRRTWAGRIGLAVVGLGSLAVLAGGAIPLVKHAARVDTAGASLTNEVTPPSPFRVNLPALSNPGDMTGRCASVKGNVFFDADLNGVRTEGEQPAAGIDVSAYGPDDTRVAQATTGNDGAYQMRLPSPMPVRVEFDAPGAKYIESGTGLDAGWRVSFPHPPACEAVLGVNWRGQFEHLPRPSRMEIGGRAWRDDNCDGIAQPTEPAEAGTAVALFDEQGRRLADTTTDVAGRYAFGGVLRNTPYRVQVTPLVLPGEELPTVFRFTPRPSLYGATLATPGADASAVVVLNESGHSEHSVDAAAEPVGGCPAKSPITATKGAARRN